MPDVSILDVRLYGDKIGTLTLIPGERTLFAFDKAYIDNPGRPTLSLSFKDQFGQLLTEFRPVHVRVPPFFANLLPEGPLRAYLAERAGVNERREFFLLWVLGRDLPGALTIVPADGEAWPDLEDKGDEDAHRTHRINALRFSLAGVQLKFSAVESPGKGGGLTIPANGVGGSWIVKLPSQRYGGVPENEFSMMNLAPGSAWMFPSFSLSTSMRSMACRTASASSKAKPSPSDDSTAPMTAPSTSRISRRYSASIPTTNTSGRLRATSRT